MIIAFLLTGLIVHSQPEPSKNYLNYKISFIDKKGKKISFKKKDSVTLKSCKGNLSFTLSDIVYTKNSKDSLVINQTMSKNFYKLENTQSTYNFTKKNNVFFIQSLIGVHYNDFCISKSLPVLKVNKKGKTMIIRFNFGDKKQNVYLDELPLSFKEGVYEIISTKKPKLIKISTK